MSIRTIANETGLDSTQVQEVLGELKNVGYDAENNCVFVVKFLQYKGGGNPKNIATSILKDCEATRKTPFWQLFAERYPHWRKNKIGYDLGSVVKRILKSGDSSISNSIPISSSISIERHYHRRLVSQFYSHLATLHEQKIIPEPIIFDHWNPWDLDIIDKILFPIDCFLQRENNPEAPEPDKETHRLVLFRKASEKYRKVKEAQQ